jgi:hypothetical protein
MATDNHRKYLAYKHEIYYNFSLIIIFLAWSDVLIPLPPDTNKMEVVSCLSGCDASCITEYVVHIPEGRNPQLHCCRDVKTYKMELKYKILLKNKNLDYIMPTWQNYKFLVLADNKKSYKSEYNSLMCRKTLTQ